MMEGMLYGCTIRVVMQGKSATESIGHARQTGCFFVSASNIHTPSLSSAPIHHNLGIEWETDRHYIHLPAREWQKEQVRLVMVHVL